MDICVGDVFEDKGGTKFRVMRIWLPTYAEAKDGQRGKAEVLRLKAPKWDDGRYVWQAEAFAEGQGLRLVAVA